MLNNNNPQLELLHQVWEVNIPGCKKKILFLTVQSQHCDWTSCGEAHSHGVHPQSLFRGILGAGRPPAEAEFVTDSAGCGKLRKVGSVCIQGCSGLSRTPHLRQRYSQSLSAVSWSLGDVSKAGWGQKSGKSDRRIKEINTTKQTPSPKSSPWEQRQKICWERTHFIDYFFIVKLK